MEKTNTIKTLDDKIAMLKKVPGIMVAYTEAIEQAEIADDKPLLRRILRAKQKFIDLMVG